MDHSAIRLALLSTVLVVSPLAWTGRDRLGSSDRIDLAVAPVPWRLTKVSDYCLAHHYRNPNYHPVHVRLLRHLRRITGDGWFGRMADLYAADVR